MIISEDARSRIREAIEDFISVVDEEMDSVPEEHIKILDPLDMEENEFILKKPQRLLSHFLDRQHEFFREIARWMDESGEGYELSADLTQEARIREYESTLFILAGEVMAYSGGFEVTDSSFNAALIDHLQPKYEERVYAKFAVPAHGIYLPENIDVELCDKLTVRSQQTHHYLVESISLSAISKEDRLGISRKKDEERNWSDLSNVKLEIEISTRDQEYLLGQHEYDIALRVSTALRLFFPEANAIRVSDVYEVVPNWIQFRTDIPNFHRVYRISTGTSVLQQNQAEPSRSELSDFAEFWREFYGYIRIDKEGTYSRPLRRFNKMYDNRDLEDSLVDCLIALEGTVLKDVSPNSSYTFRLKLRTGILVDEFHANRREHTRRFAHSLYKTRGKIVHEDKRIHEILEGLNPIDGQQYAVDEFLQEARTLLSSILKSYFIMDSCSGKNITETNQAIDQAAYEAEIHLGGN